MLKKYLIPFVITALLVSCTDQQLEESERKILRDPIDRELDMTRWEAKDAIRPSSVEKAKMRQEEEALIKSKTLSKTGELDFQPNVIAPLPPDVNNKKRVSLSVTEKIDVKDVLQELARLSELELALDPNISGGIILSVTNRPVNEVLQMVADLAELRYTVEKGVLKVTKDNPYLVNYNVDFLNLIRSASGNINTQTKVLSSVADAVSGGSGGGGSGGGAAGGSSGQSDPMNSGSTNVISTTYSGDLWKSIEENLIAIVGSNLATLKSGEVEEAQSASAIDLLANKGKEDTSKQVDKQSLEDKGTEQTKVLDVKSNVVATSTKGTLAGKVGGKGPSSYYTINKQAGIISVMSTEKKHKAVRDYIESVRASMSAQVLIEAKVIEVNLYDQYATGIDWKGPRIGNFIGNILQGPEVNKVLSNPGNAFSGVISSSDITLGTRSKPRLPAVAKVIEGFGISRTLSNPRITILNNQQAVLSFARNQTYYTVTGSLQQNTALNSGSNQTVNMPITISSKLHTIPIGVILTLQPSIDLDKQEVTMHIRPTVSTKYDDGVPDPAVELLKQSIVATANAENAKLVEGISSKVPVVQVRELDTILKAKSGDIMVIGGLIQHDDKNTDEGLPFVSRIPIIGNLTKRVEKSSNVIETVILMQATILGPKSNYHPADKNLYENFTQDARPLVFND